MRYFQSSILNPSEVSFTFTFVVTTNQYKLFNENVVYNVIFTGLIQIFENCCLPSKIRGKCPLLKCRKLIMNINH